MTAAIRKMRAEAPEKEEHRGLERSGDHVLGRSRHRSHLLVRSGFTGRDAPGDLEQRGVGRGHADPRSQPAHHVEDVLSAILPNRRLQDDGNEIVDPGRSIEIVQGSEVFRHDPHDPVGAAVHEDRPAQDVGGGIETALPEPVAQDGHGIVSRAVLVRSEGSAQARFDSEDLEIVRLDGQADEPFRRAGEGNVLPVAHRAGQSVEDPAQSPEIPDVAGSHRSQAGGVHPLGLRDVHQTVRFGKGQGPQDDPVHEAEHRGIGADAKGERADGEGRGSRAALEASKGEVKVVQHLEHLLALDPGGPWPPVKPAPEKGLWSLRLDEQDKAEVRGKKGVADTHPCFPARGLIE